MIIQFEKSQDQAKLYLVGVEPGGTFDVKNALPILPLGVQGDGG
jgi:hypothetical protein